MTAVLGLLGLVLLGIGATGLVAARAADWALRKTLAARPGPHAARPPLSILRPVKGLDAGLADNFASLASQAYPEFEILIGAHDPADPALTVARALARQFKHVRVLVCPRETGLNPKVSILEALSAAARHDHLLISDSNVRVPDGYLTEIAEALARPNTGLVTHMIVGHGADCTGSRLESLQLATFVARGTLFAQVILRRACVVGKSMCFRRTDLQRLGGWAQVRNVLAEDYLLGRAFERAGLRVVVAPSPIACHVPGWGVQRFLSRHLRWAQMRRRISLLGYCVEPLLYPSPFLLAAVGCCWLGEQLVAASLAALGLALTWLFDARLLQRLQGAAPSVKLWPLLLLKDVLMLAVWCVAGFRRTTEWRGHRLRIGRGSQLRPSLRGVEPAARAA